MRNNLLCNRSLVSETESFFILCRSRSYHRGIGVLGRSALSIERGQPVGVEVRSCQVILRSRASAPLHRPGRWGNTTVAPSWYCNNLSFTEGLFLVAPHWATRAWTWESAKDIYRPRHHHHLLPAACCQLPATCEDQGIRRGYEGSFLFEMCSLPCSAHSGVESVTRERIE